MSHQEAEGFYSVEAAEYDQVLEIALFPDQTRAMRELSKSSNGKPKLREVKALAREIGLMPQQVKEWIKTDPDCFDDLAKLVDINTEAIARDLALQPVRAPKPPNPSQDSETEALISDFPDCLKTLARACVTNI